MWSTIAMLLCVTFDSTEKYNFSDSNCISSVDFWRSDALHGAVWYGKTWRTDYCFFFAKLSWLKSYDVTCTKLSIIFFHYSVVIWNKKIKESVSQLFPHQTISISSLYVKIDGVDIFFVAPPFPPTPKITFSSLSCFL